MCYKIEMTRQLIKNDVPELWRQRAKAGLCPTCGKTRQEFQKGMIVYCSPKCRDEYASHYTDWATVREKILKRDNDICKKCGMNDEVAEKKWEKSKKKELKVFFEKEKEAIDKLRDDKLQELSREFEMRYNDIIDDFKFFRNYSWDLRVFEKDYPDIFAYSFRSPVMEVDHIKSLINGGDMFDENNLQTLCQDCHKKKTKKDMLERKRRKIKTKKLN